MNNNEKYGPLPRDSDPFTRRCRFLQSWYRVEVLKIPECGPWRPGGRRVGSSLIDGEASGANFISPAAFAYAKRRVADRKDTKNNPDLTIDEFRLFNNMLSSMPMCFNLFADFRAALPANRATCSRVLGAIFNTSPIRHVKDVVVEMIPEPLSDYIDDKTAWDAAVFFSDPDGHDGLASIETKYTDKLGGNTAAKQDKKFRLAKELRVFRGDGLKWYEKQGFDQVARNLLLTIAYAQKHHLAHAKNYVLAPRNDKEAPKVVLELKSRLAPRYKESIESLPLETLVERGIMCADDFFSDHLTDFYRRYLDFDQIGHF